MEPQHNPTPPERPRPAEAPPTPKKRFRIVKLEERVAPRKGGNHSHSSSSSTTAVSGVSAY
jgi:hypothetical protein